VLVVDTNVLVYAANSTVQFHGPAANGLIGNGGGPMPGI
jgi:hypothetical protein